MAKDPNQVTIRGRLTRDPELRATAGGVSVCNLSIASSGRVRNRDTNRWEDGDPFYWECEAWRSLAEHIASSFSKGDEVIAIARPKSNEYMSRDGTRVRGVVWQLESLAAAVDHATVSVTRARGPRTAGAPGTRPARPPAPDTVRAEPTPTPPKKRNERAW